MNRQMYSHLLVFLLFLVSAVQSFAKRPLSDQAHISVVTIGPYQGELYSAFGHCVFRVEDPISHLDIAYSYGEFDFNQPNFYLNYTLGYLYYRVGTVEYPLLRDYYIHENRYIHEQILNLTPQQREQLNAYLEWNAQPENRDYLYDYFYNNCATRIRDVIKEALTDSIFFDGSYINTQYSIRDLTDLYLRKQPWGDLGIDICLGLPMDKIASPNEYMFLPDYLETGLNHAFFISDGARTPLVAKTVNTYEVSSATPVHGLPHPLWFFSGLALVSIVLSVIDLKRKKLSRWFDSVLFGISGLIGLLLFMLWAFTDHRAAAYNFNLLWALPTHIVIAFALYTKRPWVQQYFMIVATLGILVLITWPLLPQALNTSLIPVVITLALRAFMQFYIRRIT